MNYISTDIPEGMTIATYRRLRLTRRRGRLLVLAARVYAWAVR